MKTQKEIESMANDFVSLAFNKQDLYDGFINGYTQCQEDRKHFLSKETLDELFDAHDSNDFIHEDSDKKYTEEDMRELYAYAKTPDVVFYKKNGSKELPTTNLENYLQTLNKQNSEWLTMKEGDIIVNFKPMPEFDDPKYPIKDMKIKHLKYNEEDVRDAIRNTITYLATLSETGKFHSGNIIEEAIINLLNKQD